MILLIFFLAILAGCDEDNPGLDPPEKDFFFPTGMALSPDGSVLFVNNGNSDLRYNGSTIMALDASMMLDALESHDGCSRADDDSGQWICDESPMVRYTVRVPSFTGSMVVVPGVGSGAYRLFVVSRSKGAVVWLDVHTDGSGMVTCMDCGQGCPDSWPQECSDSHMISEPLPDDPVNLFYDSDTSLLYITHLTEPYISVVDPAGEQPSLVASVRLPLSSYGSYTGTYDVIRVSDNTLVITASYGAELVVAHLDDSGIPVPYRALYTRAPSGPMRSSLELRGLALLDDETLAFVARTPPTLGLVRFTDESVQERRFNLEYAVDLAARPSKVYALKGAQGAVLVATSFSSGEALVLSASDGSLLQRTYVGVGPSEAIFMGHWMLVSNFGEGTLAAVATDSSSPSFLTRVLRFGEPTKLER